MPTTNRDSGYRPGPYELFMLALSIWALTLLGSQTFFHLDQQTSSILELADNFVCLLFLADFAYNLAKAPNRMRYMLTWGWVDLLSSIPTVDALRVGRAARVVRVLRVLRALKSVRAVAQFVVARRGESAPLAVALLALLMIVFSSIAVLHFEVPAGGNITSAEDAMWWAITTMTTVGYGDRYPITSEGRMVAVFLMCVGVGVVGTISGLLAAWFLAPTAKDADTDLAEIKATLREIQMKLAETR